MDAVPPLFRRCDVPLGTTFRWPTPRYELRSAKHGFPVTFSVGARALWRIPYRRYLIVTSCSMPVRRLGCIVEETTENVAPTKDLAVTALPNWISPSAAGREDTAPVRARACHALHAASKGESRRPANAQRVMQRGAERC